jgi:CheY-like chemotaxis protein/HPt (histidine-containing phosphotransfer) domain-containing protein
LEAAASIESAAKVPESDLLRDIRVLIVDDNRTIRRILKATLDRCEARPASVENGEEALAALISAASSGDPYRLLLSDMNMPGLDGIALLSEVRSRPAIASTPVVILSSGEIRGDAERCRQMGVAAYLYKPVRRKELLAALQAATGQLARLALAKPPVPAPAARRAHQAGVRILLAEDNKINQAVVSRLIEKLGHDLLIANNGHEVLDLIENHVVDLILMDIQMPEMDGMVATVRIRAKEASTRHIPIIALTAHAMKGDRERCLDAGMDGYLAKPIDAAELAAAIAQFTEADNSHASGDRSVPTGYHPQITTVRAERIDEAAIIAKLGGDETLYAEITEIFLEEAPKHLAKLKLALIHGDSATVEAVAHSLKGELAYFGDNELSAVARDLEEAARNLDLELANALFQGVETELSELLLSISGAATGDFSTR